MPAATVNRYHCFTCREDFDDITAVVKRGIVHCPRGCEDIAAYIECPTCQKTILENEARTGDRCIHCAEVE